MSFQSANRGMMNSFPSVPSPYLNFDPQLLPQSSQPEYIFLEGAGSKQRGRFELSFTQIGTSCLIGATIGGARGIYSGIKLTSMENQTSTYNRTQYDIFINIILLWSKYILFLTTIIL